MNQRTSNGTHTKALSVNEVCVEHSYTPPSNRLGHAN
jgi:hypothetical protein